MTQSIISPDKLASIQAKANAPVFTTDDDLLAFVHQAHLQNGITFVASDDAFDINKNYVQTYGVDDKGKVTLDGVETSADQIYASIEDIIGDDEIIEELQKVAQYVKDASLFTRIKKNLLRQPSSPASSKNFLGSLYGYKEKRFGKKNQQFTIALESLPPYLQTLYLTNDPTHKDPNTKIPIITLIKNHIRTKKQEQYKGKATLSTIPIKYSDLELKDQERFKEFLKTRSTTFDNPDQLNPPKHIIHLPRTITAIQMLGILLDIQTKYPDDPAIATSLDDLRNSSAMGHLNYTIATAQKDMLAIMLQERRDGTYHKITGKQAKIDRVKQLRGDDFINILRSGLKPAQIDQLFMQNQTNTLSIGFRRELFKTLSKGKEKNPTDQDFSLIDSLKSGLVDHIESIDILSETYLDSVRRAKLELRDYMLTGTSNGTQIRSILSKILGDDIGTMLANKAIKLKDQLKLQEKAAHLRKLRDELHREKQGTDSYTTKLQALADQELAYVDEIMTTIHQSYIFSETHNTSFTSSGNHLTATQEMVCTGVSLLTQSCLESIGVKVYGMTMNGHASAAICCANGNNYAIDTTRGKKCQITGTVKRNKSNSNGTINADQVTMYKDKSPLSLTMDPNHATLSDILSNIAANLPPGQEDLQITLYTQSIKYNEYNESMYYNRGVSSHKKGEDDKAIEDYTIAINLNPQYAYAYSNRGASYNRKRKYDKAIADYTTAIDLNPQHENAYYSRGISSEELYKLDTTKNISHLYQATHDRFICRSLDSNNRADQLTRAKKDGRSKFSKAQKIAQLQDNSDLHTLITTTAVKTGKNQGELRKQFKKEVAGVID